MLMTMKAEHKISRHIYGQFAEHVAKCIYGGLWVGPNSPIPNTRGIRNDIIEALRRIKVPNVRWPGGNFARNYNWKDGIGPFQERPDRSNAVCEETNHFGTHEFFDFCQLIECEPYLCANVANGSPSLMQEWMDYITYDGPGPITDLRRKNGREQPWQCILWAIGNEEWQMSANHYAEVYKHFAISAVTPGTESTVRVACGARGTDYGNPEDYEWTEILMRQAHMYMEGLALHRYIVPRVWTAMGPSVDFGEEDWFLTMSKTVEIEEFINKHSAIMDKYDPEKRVAMVIDEWGTWYDPLPGYTRQSHKQQNTIRDAVVAGAMLNMFNNHCDRLRIANIAQMVNVLQCMAHVDGEQMCLTPTYHVFDLYKAHHEATLIPSILETELYWYENGALPALSCSASIDDAGGVHVTLVNLNPLKALDVAIEIDEKSLSTAEGRIVGGDDINDHNTFDGPDRVKIKPFDEFASPESGIETRLPAASVVMLELK